MKNIALDRDGVMTELDHFQLENGEKFFKKLGNLVEIHPEKYDIEDIFTCKIGNKEALRYLFWARNLYQYFIALPPKEGCKEFIDLMHQEGKKVFSISAGFKLAENSFLGFFFRKCYEDWLKKNYIEFDGIDYCSEKFAIRDKVMACKKRKIELMGEDRPHIVTGLREAGITTAFFKATYNESDPREKVGTYSDLINLVREIELKEKEEQQNLPFVINGKFKRLSTDKLNQLTVEQYQKYCVLKNEMRCETLAKQAYDEQMIIKQEKNYKLGYRIMIPIFNVLFHPYVLNKKEIPYQKNVIWTCNHRSYLDHFTIMSGMGNHPCHPIAATELLDLWRGKIYQAIGCTFVDRSSEKSRGEGLNRSIQINIHGGDTFYFPEGTRNKYENARLKMINAKEKYVKLLYSECNNYKKVQVAYLKYQKLMLCLEQEKETLIKKGYLVNENEELLPFQEGAVLNAQISGVPIIPTASNHSYKLFRKKNLIVKYGEPIFIEPYDDLKRANLHLEQVTKQLLNDIHTEEQKRKTKTKKEI